VTEGVSTQRGPETILALSCDRGHVKADQSAHRKLVVVPIRPAPSARRPDAHAGCDARHLRRRRRPACRLRHRRCLHQLSHARLAGLMRV